MDNCGHTHTLGVETPQKHEQLKLITDDETKKVKLNTRRKKKTTSKITQTNVTQQDTREEKGSTKLKISNHMSLLLNVPKLTKTVKYNTEKTNNFYNIFCLTISNLHKYFMVPTLNTGKEPDS